MKLQDLANRVRGEYAEMPGLSLTVPQAARLWNLDPTTCERLFNTLVRENVLSRTPSGRYVALPQRAIPVKAALREALTKTIGRC